MRLVKSFKVNHITSIVVAAFPILCLSYGKGYNLAAILLFLASLCLLFVKSEDKTNLQILKDSRVQMVISAFVLYFSLFVLSVVMKNGDFSEVDMPSRVILSIPVLLAAIKHPPKVNWVMNGFVIGAIAAGCVALIQIEYLGLPRAFWGNDSIYWLKGYMAIQSGNMAMSLGVISLVICVYYFKCNKCFLAFFAVVGAMLGILGSLLSGSRGGWVFLPIALIYLVYANRDVFSLKKISLLIISVLFIGFTAIQLNPDIASRISHSIQNVQDYASNKNTDTSIGDRFQLWESAINSFSHYPILGAGYKERLVLRKEFAESGAINQTIGNNDTHSHNQYLEDLSVRGTLGFLALLGILFTPIYIFNKNNNNSNLEIQAINQCGIISIIMMLGYLLSQAMFRHNSGIIFYSIVTVIFLALSINNSKK
ncbi:O-antigen ligase family protein [Photobacterium swingsii]|uniref:O-antigen ligase family protein n=1 Tax=Photobacterium swingsii TaxID=680026 RepID=UPI00406980A2